MTATTFDRERVVRLLTRDVSRTLGERFRDDVLAVAANVEELVIGWMAPPVEEGYGAAEKAYPVEDAQRDFDLKVVDDFQQYVLDTHVHTTWPPCPRHPNHPMDYSVEHDAWCCPRDGAPIAPLGELRPPEPTSPGD